MTENLDRYYKILGLDRSASRNEIKRAYRRLALRYHPDKNPGDHKRAAVIFTAINKAYSVLIDKAHVGEAFDNVEDAKLYFKRHFYDLTCRINNADYISGVIQQEECDFFFKYQLEEVHCVKRSAIEARRIIDLIRKAMSKGYDVSRIAEEHSEFFQKHGFYGQPQYDNYEELIKEYKCIINEEPGNAKAHYELGCIYEKQNMLDAAISEYRIALLIDPQNNDAKNAVERMKNS